MLCLLEKINFRRYDFLEAYLEVFACGLLMIKLITARNPECPDFPTSSNLQVFLSTFYEPIAPLIKPESTAHFIQHKWYFTNSIPFTPSSINSVNASRLTLLAGIPTSHASLLAFSTILPQQTKSELTSLTPFVFLLRSSIITISPPMDW